jgi:hypothetical protein
MAAKKAVDEGRVHSPLNDGLIKLNFRYASPGDDLLQELIRLAGDVDRYLQRIERGNQDGIRHERENMRSRIAALKAQMKAEGIV